MVAGTLPRVRGKRSLVPSPPPQVGARTAQLRQSTTYGPTITPNVIIYAALQSIQPSPPPFADLSSPYSFLPHRRPVRTARH